MTRRIEDAKADAEHLHAECLELAGLATDRHLSLILQEVAIQLERALLHLENAVEKSKRIK